MLESVWHLLRREHVVAAYSAPNSILQTDRNSGRFDSAGHCDKGRQGSEPRLNELSTTPYNRWKVFVQAQESCFFLEPTPSLGRYGDEIWLFASVWVVHYEPVIITSVDWIVT